MFSRTRRRLVLEKQQRTEEQTSTVTSQLLQVGEILGRLNAATDRFLDSANRFEDAANRIVEACIDDNGVVSGGESV